MEHSGRTKMVTIMEIILMEIIRMNSHMIHPSGKILMEMVTVIAQFLQMETCFLMTQRNGVIQITTGLETILKEIMAMYAQKPMENLSFQGQEDAPILTTMAW
jgi:hypothetical protein